jgi:hypothetical protein
MALKPLNSVGGFSVGEIPANVILANSDIFSNRITVNTFANLGGVANLYIGGGNDGQVLQTDGNGNLSWTSSANVNQIHNGNSNVTIPDVSGNVYIHSNSGVDQQWSFTTTGNTLFPATGTANLGNLVTANFANFTNNIVVQGNIANANNISITNNLDGNTANFSGNLVSLNANLGNLVTANFANFMNNIVVQGNIANANNISITNNLDGNTANFSGNITSLNANLGNLVTANYGNFTNDLVVQGDIANANNVNVTNTLTTYNANITGNVTAGNVDGGNLVVANSFTSNGGTVDFATNNPNVQLGNVANVHIGGGSASQYLQTDGAGNLTWTTADTTTIANGTSNVSIPLANGNVNTSVGGNANVFVVTGTGANVTGTLDVSGNLTSNNANFTNDLDVGGNIVTGTGSGGNITGANVISANTFSGVTANLTGNLTALNADLGNLATANFVNVSSNTTTSNLTVNLELSGNTANFSGNVITPNLTVNLELAGNTANFTGNVVAANFIGSLANGNSNVKVYQDANVEITVSGSPNTATFASTGLYVVGQINTTAGNMLSNGNITANIFLNSANANVTGQAELGSVLTSNITATSSSITISAAGANNNIILSPTGSGNVTVGLHNITQVALPVNPNDAATKEYVDNISQGLYIHPAANVTSLSNLTASYLNGGTPLTVTTISGGNTITFSTNHGLSVDSDIEFTNSFNGITAGEGYFVYSVPAANQITIKDGYFGAEITTLTNGTGLTQPATGEAGVGATLTNSGAQSALTIDSILMTVGARVLVQGQTTQTENGIYEVTTVGTGSTNWVLTRASDGNSYAPKSDTQLGAGSYFFVMQGTQYAGSSYVLTQPPGEIHFGTSNIVFSQFSKAGAYTAGNGIYINGTIISANVDFVTTDIVAGNIVVKTSANLTTPNIGDATFSSLSWNNLSNGNVTANNLSIGNIANITGNLRVDGEIQSNGNVSSNAYINGNNASFTNYANIGGNLLANNITSNFEFSTNTANITSNLVTSNATVNLELSGNTANFSSNVIINNLTVNLELAGNTANFSGNVVLPNLTVNLELAGNTANFSGNVIANNFSTTGAAGNISGANVIFANSFTSNGGTVDFDTNNANVKLGSNANVHLYGGNAGQVLQTDGSGNLSWTSSPSVSIIQNGTSNVTIPTANGNVITNVNGNSIITVTGTGANVTGTLGVSSNVTGANVIANSYVFAPEIVQNASTYDTRVSLSSVTGIVQITSGGNSTQFGPGGQVTLGGASQIVGGTFEGSQLQLDTTQTNLKQLRGGNVTIQVGTGGTTANTWTFVNNGNTIFPAAGTANLGNIAIANTANISNNIVLGNTAVNWGTLTTASIAANQTIAQLPVSGITGIEFLIKGIDSTGSKYSVATVQAVTDGSNVDYSIYGGVFLTGSTGVLAVNLVGSNIALQVTPSSTNSTVWTTQFRTI